MTSMNELYLILIFLFVICFASAGSVLVMMNYKKLLREIREVKETSITPPVSVPFVSPKEVFVTFPCGNCTEQIVVEEHLMPGDIHVIDCENCKTSWSIYNPSLVIKQTKELPDSLKTAVAQNMAELNA